MRNKVTSYHMSPALCSLVVFACTKGYPAANYEPELNLFQYYVPSAGRMGRLL